MAQNKPGPCWQPGCRCHYCGQLLGSPGGNRPHSFSRDHVVPRSAGGSNRADNVVAACRRCNLDKGCLRLEEWRAVLARRQAGFPVFTDPQTRWLERQGFRFPEPPLWLFWFEERMIAEMLS